MHALQCGFLNKIRLFLTLTNKTSQAVPTNWHRRTTRLVFFFVEKKQRLINEEVLFEELIFKADIVHSMQSSKGQNGFDFSFLQPLNLIRKKSETISRHLESRKKSLMNSPDEEM